MLILFNQTNYHFTSSELLTNETVELLIDLKSTSQQFTGGIILILQLSWILSAKNEYRSLFV